MGSKLKILIPTGIVVILLLAFGAVSMAVAADDGKILNGVYINKTSVGGMTKDEAGKLISEKYNQNVQNKKITIVYKSKKYSIDYKDLKAGYNINETVDKAYNYGKNGNVFTKFYTKLKLRQDPFNFDMSFSADTSTLNSFVKKVSKDVNIEPKDAKISFNGSNFTVTPGEEGLKVNEAKLEESLKASVRQDIVDEKVEVPVEKSEPKVSEAALKKVDTKISSFTTSFKPSDVNRTGNLRIASEAIDGKVLMPGEIFSMNKALGPRVASKGYTEAPIIIKNTVVPSLAGGICQVTTTVYNAALYANFQIVERRNHGLLVSYVGAGRDATISGDAIDMKFKNTNSSPVYIQAVMGKITLTVNFYSANEHPNQKVVISAEVTERIAPKTEYINDPTLKAGEKVVDQKPISGAKSQTYRKVYENGVLVKTELLSKDSYNKADGKIRVGTKAADASTGGTSEETTNPGQTPDINLQ